MHTQTHLGMCLIQLALQPVLLLPEELVALHQHIHGLRLLHQLLMLLQSPCSHLQPEVVGQIPTFMPLKALQLQLNYCDNTDQQRLTSISLPWLVLGTCSSEQYNE